MTIPQPPSDPNTPVINLNLTGTAGTNIVPVASFGQGNQIQQRASVDLQVSEAGMLAITVNKARTSMRNRLATLLASLNAKTAEFDKFKASIAASFKTWTADESAALSTLYATFTNPAVDFLQGTPVVEYPKLPTLDWDTGKASATFTYSYTQSLDKKGSIRIELRPVVVRDIPPDVLAIKADLDSVTREIAQINEDITKTRKALGNSAELESIARASIAEQMLRKSGNEELATALQTASDENVEGLINSLTN